MFKKLAIASAILALSSVAGAASYKGDYKGEQMAPAPCPAYTYNISGPYVGLSIGPVVNIASAPAAYTGLNGAFSLGYGALMTPGFYLAGEAFVQDSASIRNYKVTGSTAGVRSGFGYGFDLIPGGMINDHTLGYLRLGVVRSRFTDVSKNTTGWQAGLGMQTNLVDNWDLRGEYVYSQYKRIATIGRPYSNQVNFGLVYKIV